MSTTKKTITWVTPDYFVDCDFNASVLSGILARYKISWIILLPAKGARFSESDFQGLKSLPGLDIEFMYWSHRARNPKMLFFYEKLFRRIRKLNADLTYFNYVPTSPYILPLYWRLNRSKTVVTAHDGNVKSSFNRAWISKIVFRLAFQTKSYVNMFSASEASIFKQEFSNRQVFIVPLSLKNFGNISTKKRVDNIVFLFFGSIHSNKNLRLLIDAACDLYEQGQRGFIISIHGQASDWSAYQSHIRFPEIFECDIRLHSNSEIAKIFSESHYGVFPYSEVSQSGALKVALNYNLPVIVSNLSGFESEIREGVNGFFFKTCDVKDLLKVLKQRIISHNEEYANLETNVAHYNDLTYSTKAISEKYVDMFDQVIQARQN